MPKPRIPAAKSLILDLAIRHATNPVVIQLATKLRHRLGSHLRGLWLF